MYLESSLGYQSDFLISYYGIWLKVLHTQMMWSILEYGWGVTCWLVLLSCHRKISVLFFCLPFLGSVSY